MKIQFNGFDIEINQDDTNIAIKVMDANGKELSNNSYMQSNGSEEEEITDADVTSVEDAAAEEGVEETPEDTESTDETTEVETTEVEEDETSEEGEDVGESYLPSFEDFKKKLNK